MSVNPASSKRTASALALEDTYVPADERRAKGKALRDDVPRASHAGWKAQKGRRDPIDLLRATNAGRVESLIPICSGARSRVPAGPVGRVASEHFHREQSIAQHRESRRLDVLIVDQYVVRSLDHARTEP